MAALSLSVADAVQLVSVRPSVCSSVPADSLIISTSVTCIHIYRCTEIPKYVYPRAHAYYTQRLL